GHLRTHHGTWTYKDKGGRLVSMDTGLAPIRGTTPGFLACSSGMIVKVGCTEISKSVGGGKGGLFSQSLQQYLQRLGAMAEAVFYDGVQLGHRFAKIRHEKMRVIAKTIAALGRIDDLAMPQPLGNDGHGIVSRLHVDQNRNIT